jgi:DNA-binding transcriptional ArsR family regulator
LTNKGNRYIIYVRKIRKKEMRTETLSEIYRTVIESRTKLTRSEIVAVSGYSQGTVNKAITVLRRAGLIKEHYIAKMSRFGKSDVNFCVLDTSDGEEYSALLFDESLEVRETRIFRPNPSFAIHDNMRSFVSESEAAFGKRRVVSVCLIPNEKYNMFCSAVIPEYIARVRTERNDAARRMREKYFEVKLRDYLKKA